MIVISAFLVKTSYLIGTSSKKLFFIAFKFYAIGSLILFRLNTDLSTLKVFAATRHVATTHRYTTSTTAFMLYVLILSEIRLAVESQFTLWPD